MMSSVRVKFIWARAGTNRFQCFVATSSRQSSYEMRGTAPRSTAECLDIAKQTVARLRNGIRQFVLSSGIKLGLNDTVLSIVTIGFDLTGSHRKQNMNNEQQPYARKNDREYV